MVEEVKGKRGRPLGSGIPTDLPILHAAADMMVASPGLRHTTAFKRLKVKDAAAIRRLQDKWKKGSEQFLAAARERLARQRQKSAGTGGSYIPRGGYGGLYADPMQEAIARAGLPAQLTNMPTELNPLYMTASQRAEQMLQKDLYGDAMKLLQKDSYQEAMKLLQKDPYQEAMKAIEREQNLLSGNRDPLNPFRRHW